MHSALEVEAERLLSRLRDWLSRRDRAVLFGVALCCVPFLPVTGLGVLVTLINLGLVSAGKLPLAELPVLLAGLVLAVLYAVLWWLLFGLAMRHGAGWWFGWMWQWLHGWAPATPHGPVQNV